MDRFELQQLRDLPIEGVAERLGLHVEHHKALCPFHDDHHASLSFNVRKNTFRCFVCGEHGNPIDLVMRLLHKDFCEACQWLGGMGGMDGMDGMGGMGNCHGNSTRHTFDARRYERFFERPWLSEPARNFLFNERRLDPRVIRWCRLTSWRDRKGTDWLQIPYYDRDGNLIGIQNRNLNYGSRLMVNGSGLQPSAQGSGSAPRFRFPKGSRCGIYNLPILGRLHDEDDLWIAEGCSDCWALLSAGHKAIAIPSATLLKPKDLDQLFPFSSSLTFHMAPDRDAPGERLFLQLQRMLPNLEHHQLPPGCKDYSDYYLKMKISR